MKNKLKSFWYQFGGWFLLLGVPLEELGPPPG